MQVNRPLAALVALLSIIGGAPAAEAGVPEAMLPAWSAQGDPNSVSHALVVTSDGSRAYVAGSRWRSPLRRAWAAGFDTDVGTLAWSFTSRHESEADAVGVTSDGDVVVLAGWISPTSLRRHSHLAVWAFDRDGTPRWSARFAGNGADGGDRAADLAISPDGTTAYVTGWVWNEGRRMDLVVAAYRTSDGGLRWRRVIDLGPARNGGGVSELGRAITVTPDGTSVIVTGYTGRTAVQDNADLRSRALTMAFAADRGTTRWRVISARSDGDDPTPGGVDLAVWGAAVYVAGASWFSGEESFTARHQLGDGGRRWVSRHQVGADIVTLAEAVAVDRSSAYLAGPASGAFHVWAQRASDGGIRWKTPSSLRGTARDLALAGGGARIYVAGGLAAGEGELTFAVLGIDTDDGSIDWRGGRSPADAGQYEQAVDVAVDPDGTRVYVAGHQRRPDVVALVAAYDP